MSQDLLGTTEALRHRAGPPAVHVAVITGDEVRAVAAAGCADVVTGAESTLSDAANWFSLSKIATATAALVLSEAGSLDLNAPVSRYLGGDWWPAEREQVRVKHLLTHSGGLWNPLPLRWVHRPDQGSVDQGDFLARRLARQPLPRFGPGQTSCYSNVGYLALGQVIAAAASTTYADFVRSQLLAPLGMASTGFSWSEPCLAGSPRMAAHHSQPSIADGLLRAAVGHRIGAERTGAYLRLNPFDVDGHAYGGLIGPIHDVARLVTVFSNGGSASGTRILSRASVAAMTTIQIPGRAYDLGYGWFKPHGDTRSAVEHLGGGLGYWHLMRVDAHAGRAVVIMSNSTRHWPISAEADSLMCLGSDKTIQSTFPG